MPLTTVAATTDHELAALAWAFDATAVVLDGPTVLDDVPAEHRAAVAGSLLLSLATKDLVDLGTDEDGEPRLRPTPTWPALPAQVTAPDRWLRFRRSDRHGTRTRHLLGRDGHWLVLDTLGGLHVVAPCTRDDLADLAAAALALDDAQPAGTAPTGSPEVERPTGDPVPAPPPLGFRSDLWSCGPAGGRTTGAWRRWCAALGDRDRTAVDVDLVAHGPAGIERSWFTVLATDDQGWIAGPDPDGTVVDPAALAGPDAPATTEALAPAAFGAVVAAWLADGADERAAAVGAAP